MHQRPNRLEIEAEAPRFHALWQKRAGKTILIMERDCWRSLRSQEGAQIPIDLERTPLSAVEQDACVEAAVISRTTKRVKITIYRRDSRDEPTEINTDNYSVYEGLPSNLDVDEMVETASTAADSNFRDYADNSVFIIKDKPDDDHWLEKLPPEVEVVIKGVNR